MTIDEIRENFELLEEWDDRYRYVIELGRTLEPLMASSAMNGQPIVQTAPSGGGGGGEGGPSSSLHPLTMRHAAFRLPQLHNVNALLSPSGHHVVCGGSDGFVYAWAAHSGEFVEAVGDERERRRKERAAARARARTTSSGPPSSSFSPGSPAGVAVVGALEGPLAALDDPIAQVVEPPHRGSAVLAIDWSGDGRMLASCDDRGRTVLWEAGGFA